MGGDGTPEESTKQLGQAISRLRTSRNVSRIALAIRAIHKLPENHPLAETIGENWLNRLESGRMVKVTHDVIEAILNALDCSPTERASVLMHANRNPLADNQGNTSPEAEVLGQIMVEVYEKPEVRSALKDLKNSNHRSTGAIAEFIADAIVHLTNNHPK